MFKIFRRRKDKSALTYGVIQRLSEVIERKQRKLASYLNNRTKGFSKKQWIWLLAGLCIAFSAVSIDILLDSMRLIKQFKNIKPANISVPVLVGRHDKAADSLEDFECWYGLHIDSIKKVNNKNRQVWKNK